MVNYLPHVWRHNIYLEKTSVNRLLKGHYHSVAFQLLVQLLGMAEVRFYIGFSGVLSKNSTSL